MSFYRGTGTPGTGTAASRPVRLDELAASDGSSLVGFIQSGTGAVATTVQTELRHSVNVEQFGAVGDGVTDNTTAFANAYTAALTAGTLIIPPGTFKGNFVFDGGVLVKGSGKKATILAPQSTLSPVVEITGDTATGKHLEAGLFDLTIDCQNTAAVGLVTGDSATSSGFSNGTIARVDIKNGTGIGWTIDAATNCTFNQVYVYNFDVGVDVVAERNIQVNTYFNCRFRLCRVGAYLRSGNRETYVCCNWESNDEVGLRIERGTSSGPSSSVFQTCWLEDNGPVGAPSTSYASLMLDIVSGVATTAPHNILFQNCIITSKSGAYDIRAIRANGVEFDRCSFSDLASGGFSSSKFSWSSADPRVLLRNCGSLNQLPYPTLYASFPALTADTNGQLTMGFEYIFDYQGIEYTNRKWNTFTPIIVGSSTAGAGTYSVQSGRYRKIGNIVYFFIRLIWSAHTGTGNMDVGGLPVTSSASSILGTCSVYSDGITLTANNILMARLAASSTTITLRQTPVGSTTAAVVPIDTAGELILSGFYEA